MSVCRALIVGWIALGMLSALRMKSWNFMKYPQTTRVGWWADFVSVVLLIFIDVAIWPIKELFAWQDRHDGLR